MLRLLFTPRWVAGTLFALLATAVCWGLGAWQVDRAQLDPRPVDIADERVIPFVDVAAQSAAAGVPFPAGLLVRTGGSYAAETFSLAAPVYSGQAGESFEQVRWTATTLRAAGSAAADVDPTTLVVVRGLARPAPSAPRDGDVVVTGRLQPPEPSGDLDADALVARGADPRGYLVLTSQVPADARPAELADSPVPLRSSGLRWQNTVYASQWFLFGGFVLFLWYRLFREDLREQRQEPAEAQ